jgi:hypothetical protein
MGVTWRIQGYYKADAQKVAEEIGFGKFTPMEVLEKAKDETTELHKCFEWNDSIAAEKYRLEQAKNIIRMLVYEKETKEQAVVRYYAKTETMHVYQPTKQFLVQEDEYQGLLRRALAELEAFKNKYHTLTELEGIFDAMETI